MTVLCDECDPPRELANAGALRIHRIAAHGAAAGHCETCDKDFKNLAVHQAKAHPTNPPPPVTAPVSDEDGEPVTDEIRPGSLGPPEPDQPTVKRTFRDRLWAGGRKPPAAEPPTKERRPSKRSSASPLLSMAWGGAGTVLVQSQLDPPVGRVMQLQSIMAGDVLDRLIAKTWIDRLLQPVASRTDEMEAAGALFALPALVAVMERSPAAQQTLMPALRMAIQSNLAQMAPALKKQQQEADKLAKTVADLDLGIPGTGEGVDPVDAILSFIAGPPPEPMPPDPSANGATHADTGDPAQV